MKFTERLAHAWNAFTSPKRTTQNQTDVSYGSAGSRMITMSSPTRSSSPSAFANKNIVENVINRMAVDVSSMVFTHARVDENDNYLDRITSGLNDCLTVQANIDQSSRSFIQDVVLTMLDQGHACVVPVDTTINPNTGVPGSFDIKSMRVGRIVSWHPQHVSVELYNEKVGARQEIVLHKETVGIVVNPFYSVMNEPNSTLQRLMQKLALLDAVDNDIANKKLDLIIQVPYVVKSEARKAQADQKRQDIEFQLRSSDYGVAWIDATDKITQLNRPVENNMLPTVEYLTDQLYSYLGITKGLLEGSATEQEFLNYFSRTIEPIASSIAEEFKRKFLTKTARTQNQSILYIRKPFKIVPMKDLAEIIDKLSRNEVTSSNEARAMLGFKPSSEPGADELRNANLPRADTDYADARSNVINEEPDPSK